MFPACPTSSFPPHCRLYPTHGKCGSGTTPRIAHSSSETELPGLQPYDGLALYSQGMCSNGCHSAVRGGVGGEGGRSIEGLEQEEGTSLHINT